MVENLSCKISSTHVAMRWRWYEGQKENDTVHRRRPPVGFWFHFTTLFSNTSIPWSTAALLLSHKHVLPQQETDVFFAFIILVAAIVVVFVLSFSSKTDGFLICFCRNWWQIRVSGVGKGLPPSLTPSPWREEVQTVIPPKRKMSISPLSGDGEDRPGDDKGEKYSSVWWDGMPGLAGVSNRRENGVRYASKVIDNGENYAVAAVPLNTAVIAIWWRWRRERRWYRRREGDRRGIGMGIIAWIAQKPA
jgi:hypothetical protein